MTLSLDTLAAAVTPPADIDREALKARYDSIFSGIAPPFAFVDLDGKLVGSRMVGNSLVLVTQFTPVLQVDALPWNAPAEERADLICRLRPILAPAAARLQARRAAAAASAADAA